MLLNAVGIFIESAPMKINPSKVRLDASTVCQLKCPACSNAEGAIARTLGAKSLKFRDFKKFVDSNTQITAIELSNWGEIFLNHDLLEIMKYAYQKKVVLNAATGVNLNTVKEEVLEGLVKYRFGFISCSIDGASSKTYKIYRKNGDFKAVIANIKKINKFKEKYKSALPQLRWQFIAFGHNEHEISMARQMANKLGMEFYVKLAWDGFSPVRNKDLVRALSRTGVVNREEYQEKYGKVYLAQSVCSQLWVEPQINCDGRVLGCCVNYWGDYGDAFQEDLNGILNNERMNYAREMLLGKKDERADIPCTQCSWYKEMKKNKTWLLSVDKTSSWDDKLQMPEEKPVKRVLRKGARLLTRLARKDIDRLGSVTEYHRVKQHSRLELMVMQENKDTVVNSSLKMVNLRLSVDLIKQIKIMSLQRKNSDDPKRKIIVLDWGAGNGRALEEIFNALRLNNISNVRLIGFGHSPFKEWHDLPKGIDMILDVAGALPLYFKKGEIDLLYSHLGLKSMDAGYYKMLYTLLREGGVLVMDGDEIQVKIPGNDLQAIKRHPVYFIKKVSGESRVLKKQVSLIEAI